MAPAAEKAGRMGKPGDLAVQLFPFSPGSGSHRGYIRKSDPKFVSSQQIFQDILANEKKILTDGMEIFC